MVRTDSRITVGIYTANGVGQVLCAVNTTSKGFYGRSPRSVTNLWPSLPLSLHERVKEKKTKTLCIGCELFKHIQFPDLVLKSSWGTYVVAYRR